MTNIEHIQARLIEADNALTEKRGRAPYLTASLQISTQFERGCNARLYVDPGMEERIDGWGETPDEALDALMAKIAAMPDLETVAMHEFQRDLGKLIDKGRDLGIDIKWLNPITEMARELAENALTHEVAE